MLLREIDILGLKEYQFNFEILSENIYKIRFSGIENISPSEIIIDNMDSNSEVVTTEIGVDTVNVEALDESGEIIYSEELSLSSTAVEFTVSISAEPLNGGTVTYSPVKDTYSYNDEIVLNVSDSEGYSFLNWEGTQSEDAADGKITVKGNIDLKAMFLSDQETVINVSTVEELKATVNSTKAGNVTVLIEDGVYELDSSLWLTGNNLTYRSKSGNRDGVVIKGGFRIGSMFMAAGDNFTIRDMSIGEVNNHAIQVHGELDADNVKIQNMRIFDTKEQMIKGSGTDATVNNDNGLVENCLFEFTQGKAYQYYTGGIDVHHGVNWIVRNNEFRNIQNPDGGLTEGAIHFWGESRGTLIENNIIYNSDRGIMLGLDNSSHYDGIVRNNFVVTNRDVGIYLCDSKAAKVYNNTVYLDSTYPNAIEYRFDTEGTEIFNNLTNEDIVSRDGGTATVNSNVTDAQSSWFNDIATGDLHLSEDILSVINSGVDVDGFRTDIDW